MKISIITCTYNSAAYLQNNINSVKNQTFQDFEHIFIDGFSTDSTIAMIEEYQREFPNKVKLFQFEPKGIANAMNKGIELSSGEYINHLHSDDSFYGNSVLQSVINFIEEKNKPDWIYGKAIFKNIENGNSMVIPHRPIYHYSTYHYLLLLINYIPHQAVFLKKDIFEKFGTFDETLKNFMDYDLWLRLSKAGVRGKFINNIVCIFSIRKDSQSTIGKYNEEYQYVFRKYVKNKPLLFLLSTIYKINRRRRSVFTMNTS